MKVEAINLQPREMAQIGQDSTSVGLGGGLHREHEECSRRQASTTGEVERANPAAEPPSAPFDRSKSSTARVRIRPSLPSSAHMLVLWASGYS